jgi:hypothetical protein
MQKKQEKVKEAKEALKELEKQLAEIERGDLPDLMAEIGTKEVVTEDGLIIKVVEEVDAKIPKARNATAMQWLSDNGFGGLIKTQVAVVFGKYEITKAEKLAAKLAAEHDGVILKEDVHHSTLKAFVKERLQAGDKIPFDLFGVFPYNKAVLKEK